MALSGALHAQPRGDAGGAATTTRAATARPATTPASPRTTPAAVTTPALPRTTAAATTTPASPRTTTVAATTPASPRTTTAATAPATTPVVARATRAAATPTAGTSRAIASTTARTVTMPTTATRAAEHPPRASTAATAEAEARPRDPCAEVLHAVRFEDIRGAERAYQACRARLAAPGRVTPAEDLRVLEDVTEALHGLRRADGAFCVAPAAPFELAASVAGARDTRGCFTALERFLTDEEAVTRFLLDDPYAAGRLASRAGLDVAAARRTRRRMALRPEAAQESLALARLVGRQFMRVCRCLPGPQPATPGSVRAMRLPPTVQAALLRGLTERGDGAEAP